MCPAWYRCDFKKKRPTSLVYPLDHFVLNMHYRNDGIHPEVKKNGPELLASMADLVDRGVFVSGKRERSWADEGWGTLEGIPRSLIGFTAVACSIERAGNMLIDGNNRGDGGQKQISTQPKWSFGWRLAFLLETVGRWEKRLFERGGQIGILSAQIGKRQGSSTSKSGGRSNTGGRSEDGPFTNDRDEHPWKVRPMSQNVLRCHW